MYLFMVLIGCTPKGRHTEQHDVFFGIATELKELIDDINIFWPEAEGKIHIDAWRKITTVDEYNITVLPRENQTLSENKLFFLNLGGYKPGEFEEYHYKKICVAPTQAEAVKTAKTTTFYKHCGFKGAESHIDDKYGVDVDDIYNVEDILPEKFKSKYQLVITKTTATTPDTEHIGYLKVSTLFKKQ